MRDFSGYTRVRTVEQMQADAMKKRKVYDAQFDNDGYIKNCVMQMDFIKRAINSYMKQKQDVEETIQKENQLYAYAYHTGHSMVNWNRNNYIVECYRLEKVTNHLLTHLSQLYYWEEKLRLYKEMKNNKDVN